MKNRNKLLVAALLAIASVGTNFAQFPGYVDIADRPIANLSTKLDANGNLASNFTRISSDTLWIMDERVYVNDGQILQIAPGTVIKAEYVADVENTNALIVARGGKLYAEGSCNAPIIFTMMDDNLDGTYANGKSIYTKEQWGGIVLLGKAQNNVAAGELNPDNPNFETGGEAIGLGNMEGVVASDPRHWYGMANQAFINDDCSGSLRYVSIRHGGSELGVNNEINALTLGSVGSGTVLDHIEIISNGDDGIEFFGGTVDLKYAQILYCEDDYIDWDQGYVGNIQFVYGVQTATEGDNGFECDGDDGVNYPRPFRSEPCVSNFTIIGNGSDSGLELKERTAGHFYNGVLINFGTFINKVTDPISPATLTWENVSENWLQGMSAGDVVPVSGLTTVPTTDYCNDLEQVDFSGAFEPNKEMWFACPEYPSVDTYADEFQVSDLNKDGFTNAADLGILIGNYE